MYVDDSFGALKDMVPMGEKSQKRNSKLQRIFYEL